MDGEWFHAYEDNNASRIVVGWMPDRFDEPPAPLIWVPDERAARIIVATLEACGAQPTKEI